MRDIHVDMGCHSCGFRSLVAQSFCGELGTTSCAMLPRLGYHQGRDYRRPDKGFLQSHAMPTPSRRSACCRPRIRSGILEKPSGNAKTGKRETVCAVFAFQTAMVGSFRCLHDASLSLSKKSSVNLQFFDPRSCLHQGAPCLFREKSSGLVTPFRVPWQQVSKLCQMQPWEFLLQLLRLSTNS